MDLDLRVKPRDLDASIRVALCDVRCPRSNGHDRPRIIALAEVIEAEAELKALQRHALELVDSEAES